MSTVDTFHIRVAGTSYRQAEVRQVQPGEPLQLVPDPGNPHDRHAIKVVREATGGEVGFVPRDRNQALLEALRGGCTVRATCDGSGRPEGSDSYGLAVRLDVTYPDS